MSTVFPDLPEDVDTTIVSDPRSDAERLVARLTELRWSVGVAESLTGGLVVAGLIAVPGASAVVRGGIVAYATEVKHTLLGVDTTLLEAHGPVHPLVAGEMADGVRTAFSQDGQRCDLGIATTGVAGPSSPDGQPVGTVHIAVSTALGTRIESLALRGTREAIRAETVRCAMRFALEAL